MKRKYNNSKQKCEKQTKKELDKCHQRMSRSKKSLWKDISKEEFCGYVEARSVEEVQKLCLPEQVVHKRYSIFFFHWGLQCKEVFDADGKKRVLYSDGKAVYRISVAFDRIYWLNSLFTLLGVRNQRLYLFSPYDDTKGYYFFEEPYQVCNVFKGFIFYSLDGKLFGLFDIVGKRKIEPFCIPTVDVGISRTWTDEFYPVQVGDHYYLMDSHGNCLFQSEQPFEKYADYFMSGATRIVKEKEEIVKKEDNIFVV